MPAGEFRESAFRRNLGSELLFACHDTTAAGARTISAVLKYRCSEQETIARLNDVEIVQFALEIVALYRCTNPHQ